MNEAKKHTDIRVLTGEEIEGFLDLNCPFKPSYYAFLLVKEGFVEVRYKLSRHVLKPSDVLMINPQVVYEFLNISKAGAMMMMVVEKNFQLLVPTRFSKLDTIHYFATSSILHLTFIAEDFSHTWQLVQMIRTKNKSKNYRFADDLIHTLFASVAYMLIERIGQVAAQQNTSENRSEMLTLEFIKLLQIHFRKHHNLDFYAERLKVSSKHLSETLKKVTGHTARELINMVLIREAKMLLANNDLKVATIAEILHFSDQFAFSKFFKRLTALNPTAYFKRHSLDGNP
ncbi:helix-turn-helix domain-containing protein [Sunxiuqinia sp. sy24]|uniref:helix-turn-helix domain-containing protein n=1 Tax=Sunxiuqinia sp. sy24 TaxID=3461495 RepID=UPI0040451F17